MKKLIYVLLILASHNVFAMNQFKCEDWMEPYQCCLLNNPLNGCDDLGSFGNSKKNEPRVIQGKSQDYFVIKTGAVKREATTEQR